MRTDCDDIRQALGLLLAGELSEDEASRVEIHLSSCPACARLRARFQKMNTLLAAAPVPTPSRDEVLLMALRARESSRRAGTVRRLVAAAAVFVTLLIPAATYFTFTPSTPSTTAVASDGVGGTFDLDF